MTYIVKMNKAFKVIYILLKIQNKKNNIPSGCAKGFKLRYWHHGKSKPLIVTANLEIFCSEII